MKWFVILAVALVAGCSDAAPSRLGRIVVGSKADTETVILENIVGQLAAHSGLDVQRRSELGGTQLVWKSLVAGEIDAYPEYTGTLIREILSGHPIRTDEQLQDVLLHEYGVRMSRPLGFNNTYAIAMLEHPRSGDTRLTAAQWESIRTITDLQQYPELRLGFSNEFLERDDGWPALKTTYRLPQSDVRGMVHDLAYVALESGAIDVTDAYATDAEIRAYQLKTLTDDRDFFPSYEAVILHRADLTERVPEVVTAINSLAGRISAADMIAMNHRAKVSLVSERQVAAEFLEESFGLRPSLEAESRWARLWDYTLEHLLLVATSVAGAVVVAVPLGILAARRWWIGQGVLAAVGLLQTVPSIAFFFLFIPLLGLRPTTAIAALFLYSLLPIVRNTCAGLQDIPRPIHESAQALGLSYWSRLRLVELPLATRSILAGIKTAAVINVGTATLGGFIGAGGYGEPIFRGIRKNSSALLLEGAIPAALMALAVQLLFDLAERLIVSPGLRLRPEH